jgi:cytochrome c oxidase subunit 2
VGPQNLFEPGGPQAEQLLDLWWVVVLVCGVTFLAVLVVFLWAIVRAPRATAATPAQVPVAERGARVAVSVAVALSSAGLVYLMVASFLTDRALARLGPPDMQVEVTGRQWWWNLEYGGVVTANELHVPVGGTVLLRLHADDVIHSFWVPNLAGKKDLMPGRQATLTFKAGKEGTYRGQCAEFCGLQHAKMALLVIAEPAERYAAWLAAQRRPAPEPRTAEEKRGREVFLGAGCAKCHTVRGTPAAGTRAPDLTHVASRTTLAAGLLPNTRGHLAGWILDPQALKPGVDMPPSRIAPADLQALLAWLESLR